MWPHPPSVCDMIKKETARICHTHRLTQVLSLSISFLWQIIARVTGMLIYIYTMIPQLYTNLWTIVVMRHYYEGFIYMCLCTLYLAYVLKTKMNDGGLEDRDKDKRVVMIRYVAQFVYSQCKSYCEVRLKHTTVFCPEFRKITYPVLVYALCIVAGTLSVWSPSLAYYTFYCCCCHGHITYSCVVEVKD